MQYQLYYWPSIQGRGEFVRLALEEIGVKYKDVARVEGEGAMLRWLENASGAAAPFAPPFLKAGRLLIAQTANILLYLGAQHGLAPNNMQGRLLTNQLQLTLCDLVTEIHDGHHPISSQLYYEDQQSEARRRTQALIKQRLPKFLGYFEAMLARGGSGEQHLVGRRLTYADLSLFQVFDGLLYAYPKAMKRIAREHPRIRQLHLEIIERPRLAAYLASERRVSFNQDGIFRHYPELDF